MKKSCSEQQQSSTQRMNNTRTIALERQVMKTMGMGWRAGRGVRGEERGALIYISLASVFNHCLKYIKNSNRKKKHKKANWAAVEGDRTAGWH